MRPAPRPTSMTGSSSRQFGLIIAYVLPGFIALAGIAPVLPAVAEWLRPVPSGQFDFSVGPPLYSILTAMALGLVLSCFRWVLIDHAHQWMGVKRPAWEDSQLDRVLGAFDYLVQSHFRYYEWCGNTLLAVLWAYAVNRSLGTISLFSPITDVAVGVLLLVLFVASRSALANYYNRTRRLIGTARIDLEINSCSMETTTVAVREKQNPSPRRSHSSSPR